MSSSTTPPAIPADNNAAAAEEASSPPPAAAERRGKKDKIKDAATTTTPTTTTTTPTTTTSLLKRVNKTSLALKSDDADAPAVVDSGIVHATKTSNGDERHVFAWLHDASDEASARALVDHLRSRGYRPSSMRFVPYSSAEKWTSRYPHAAPAVVCGPDGKVRRADGRWAGGRGKGEEDAAADDDDDDDDAGSGKKRKRDARSSSSSGDGNSKRRALGGYRARSAPKLVADGRLPNAERDELHRGMHAYLSWLHDELSALETHQAGRRQVNAAGVSVPGLRSLIAKMEGTFKSIASSSQSSSGGGGGGGNGVIGPPPLVQPGGGDVDESNATTTVVADDGDEGPKPPRILPFLERALEAELRRRVSESLNPSPTAAAAAEGGEGEFGKLSTKSSSSSSSTTTTRPNDKGRPSRRHIDFEVLYRKLVEFKDETGHACPTLKHPELGWWVSELRARRKALREMGLEWEPSLKAEGGGEGRDDSDEAAAATAAETGGGIVLETTEATSSEKKKDHKFKSTTMSNTYLSEERVQLLDSMSFVWWALPERVTWEQRLEELRAFREVHGRFPTNKEGALGNWLKGQRKLYTKKDADFMANRCAKLEEVGVLLRQRKYSALSWEDRFQQLVEFGRVNRHFNVPNPAPNSYEGQETIDDPTSEVADAKRFYKFVVKLNTDYRALQRGVPSTILTEERIAQLRNIGFEFSTKPAYKSVPDIDWPTRVQQLEAFRSEMGHMRVDPNYDKYQNIGGWAVEMSERYKAWQEGREFLPPEVIEKFDQLITLGFGFDIFPSGRGERSWDDSFALLLQYRHATGTTRVPHHYKADFRLGSWVAVQRKEYKLRMEGKPSRLTQERIHRLESVGFEWVVRRGQEDCSI